MERGWNREKKNCDCRINQPSSNDTQRRLKLMEKSNGMQAAAVYVYYHGANVNKDEKEENEITITIARCCIAIIKTSSVDERIARS
jgi:hypothetical protein